LPNDVYHLEKTKSLLFAIDAQHCSCVNIGRNPQARLYYFPEAIERLPMKIVLIAEDDRILSARLTTYMGKYEDQLDVIAVDNGKKALEVLKRRQISLLITDIQMPEMDGLELLAYINLHHPVIPCFVMTAYGTPELKKKLPRDIIRFFPKPVDVQQLSNATLKVLERDIPRGAMRGISVVNFLQMIRLEQKTCLLEVRRPDQPKGLMFFDNGVLFDATYEQMKGEEAALSIITRETAEIRFKYFPDRKIPKRIRKDLNQLIEQNLSTTEEISDEEWDDIISDVLD